MKEEKFIFSPENLSKYWKILNNSNNPNERKLANSFLSEFKKNCPNSLEISMTLFSSESIEDKLISSILIYQYIQDNPKKILKDKDLFNRLKDYVLNNILIPYTKTQENVETENTINSKTNLIIERICYTMSILIILGCSSHWPDAIDNMLSFGKQTLKHTYLMTIIFGNINNELKNLFLPKKNEFMVKTKFLEKKDEFKNFINTIFINTKNIDKKLFKKTVDLAKNFTSFEVNILQIPNLIKIILEDMNSSNIDSLSELLCESINSSKSRKIEENSDLNINEYDNKIDKDELISFNYIIDILINYLQNNTNNIDEDIIFGLGKIFSSITENYVYLFFKKDSLSQKIFNLFFFFISYKIRKISQVFFETIPIIKNFTNNYKFSNFSQNEKIEFSNFLLKILLNIINNCTFKTIKKKQDILLNEEYISISNLSPINTNANNNIEEDFIDEINEVTIEDYRVAAEDVFSNIFLIFAENYGKEGVNYFFDQITKEIYPLLNKNINELTEANILSVEVIIYAIKSIIDSFQSLNIDKIVLVKFTLIFLHSPILLNNFILLNMLLLIQEESIYFDYNKNIYSELIIFLLNQLNIKINETNSEDLTRLIATVLLSICDASNGVFIEEIWEKMFQVYFTYYDKFSFFSLYNLTESLCSCLIIQEDESGSEEDIEKQKPDFLTGEEIISHLKKLIEQPILRIIKIGEIILNKKNSEIYGNKDMEEKLRLEIIKNFNVITCVLKQSSFIEDKNIINNVFNIFYEKISEYLNVIIKEYSKDNKIIHNIMNTLTKCSSYLNINTLNQIFPKFNELMINTFLQNNDNYQCINVLKSIYSLKLQNIKDKSFSNNEYTEIYNNFLKLSRQICSTIITSSKYQLDLMICLASLFVGVFPHLKNINKDDYVIITDTIILFNEGIKNLCENNIMKNILYAFISFIESDNTELIQQKFNDIINSVFYSFDHFNSKILQPFVLLNNVSIKFNKRSYMNILKDILNSNEFNCFNNDKKNIIYNYIDHFSNNVEKLKKIFESVLNIIHKNIVGGIDDIIDNYKKELNNDINKNTFQNHWN